jgi:hypothetical protein
MTDEKKKGKALNALKKKFNAGGRVNARRGGKQNNLSFSKEDLNTAQAKEFFRSTSKTPEPKKSTQAVKPVEPKKTTQAVKPVEPKKTTQAVKPVEPKKTTQAVKPVEPKKPTGFQQMGEVIQTPAPKKPPQTAKTSAPKEPTGFQQMGAGTQTPAGISDLFKPLQQFDPSANNKTGGGLDLGQRPTKSYKELGGTEAEFRPINDLENPEYSEISRRQTLQSLGLTQKQIDAAISSAELKSESGKQPRKNNLNEMPDWGGPSGMEQFASFSQSPRGAANIQQAQNAGQAVMAQSAGTDFNIDVDLSGMPQRGDYGKGKEGNDAYQAALKAWQASLGDTGSSGGGGGDSGGDSDTPPTSEELEEKKEELKQTRENYVAPKAEVVKAGQAFDYRQLDAALMKTRAFKEGSASATYNPETGKYTLTAFGTTAEKTPEEMADLAGGYTVADFQGDDPSLSTSKEDIQKLKTGEDRTGIDDPTDITAGTTTVEQGTAKTAADVEYGVPKGYSLTPNPDVGSGFDTAVMPSAGKVFAYNQETGQRIEIDEPGAKTITADAISDEDRTRAKAATAGTFDDAAKAGVATLTQGAEAVGRDSEQEQAAMATAATRPEKRDYAKGATSEDVITVGDVTGPTVETRDGITISDEERARLSAIAQGRGVALEDLPEYKDKIKKRTAQSGEAAAGIYVPRLGETPEATAARAEYFGADYTPQGGKTEIDAIPAYAKAATRVAQVGVAAERIASELGTAPSVDFKGREAITGTAPQGDASQIGGIPTFEAASRNAVTGKERTVAAADMMAVVADIPEDVTAAISEDPATVEAQIDSGADPQVTAAVAALPQEALVSVQMENLLAGMEEGKTPAWARPAVAAIEQQMAQRGLSASTVGRDALFNAIIQSALPMAQSNAQALQQRAQQNLSNQQQANLASAQNTMTVRMQNLANRQTAASQTASMAQEIKVQQGSFSQQATITTAQQKQQSEMATFQAAQQRAQQESAQRQQAAIAELSTNAQMDLANLQALNAAGAENMSAEQQGRLTKYNAQIAKVMRQADLKQDMEKANLNASLQMRLANLSEMNAAAKDTMTAENQEELTNLQTLVDFRKTDAQFAQQMDMANMSNEQQMELAMLQDRAATDSANFTADNQFRMQELNQKVARSVRQAELNQRMEEVNLDSKLKIELSELSEKNTTSRANMTAEQQTRLANLNALVDFKKTNAAMAQQMDMANLGNEQQMELANLAERAATDSANMTEENRFRFQELNNATRILSENAQLLQQADLAKLSMEEKISLANLSEQNKAASESMSAKNIAELQVYEKKMGAATVNAQLAQQMGLANLSNKQEAAMFNAQIDANLDMKQFDANQQTALANSQFMQTMTVKDLDNRQQAMMQNATANAAMDLANADAVTRVNIENSKSFLAMDMANLSNEQQANMMNAQMDQQTLLSNQSAANAAKQFNATSENQTNQFMATLGQNANQFNTSQQNAMTQFNAAEKNRMAAMDAGNALEAEKFNTEIATQVKQFNADQDFKAEQWNAANAQAIQQADLTWRRNLNTADTAAQNAANQQQAGFEFQMDITEQTQMWQSLRDDADRIFRSDMAQDDRLVTVIQSALSNEAFMTDKNMASKREEIFRLLKKVTGT